MAQLLGEHVWVWDHRAFSCFHINLQASGEVTLFFVTGETQSQNSFVIPNFSQPSIDREFNAGTLPTLFESLWDCKTTIQEMKLKTFQTMVRSLGLQHDLSWGGHLTSLRCLTYSWLSFSANNVKHYHHICAHIFGHCFKFPPSFFSPRLSGQSPNSRKSAKLRKNFAGIFSKSGTTTAGASQQ